MTDHCHERAGAPPPSAAPTIVPSGRFAGSLTGEQRRSLLERGTGHLYRPGQVLMREGAHADIVIVITRGLAKVTAVSEGGKEILLGLRSSGDLVGEMAVLSGRARSATVTAATELQGTVIRAASFVAYLERSPQVANRVSDIMADKLRAANRRRLEFNAYGAEGRLACVLAEVALSYGHLDGAIYRIGPEITQADLASLASASVRTVEKILRILEGDGVVARRRRDLLVTDLAALEARGRSAGQIRPGRD